MKRLILLFCVWLVYAVGYSGTFIQQPDVGRPKTVNNALHFDGVNDKVTVGNIIRPQQFTIECWVNFEGNISSTYYTLVEFGNYAPLVGIWMGMPVIYPLTYGNMMTPGWHHLAFSTNNLWAYIFIDGEFVAGGDVPAHSLQPGMGIGHYLNENFWPGMIDELRIWNYARSAEQISSQMYQQLAGNEPGLVAYYNFNQGVAGGDNSGITTLIDNTTSGSYNGVLSGFTLSGTSSNFVEAGWDTSPPVADFYVNPTTGAAPLEVQFTDQSSGNSIQSWLWDFGDGQTSSLQHPVHTYFNPGLFTIKLTVNNPFGTGTKTIMNGIYVYQPEVLIAGFTVDTTSGYAPLTVNFTDLSGGNPIHWNWDFGDGHTSLQQHPDHTYIQPGIYDVTLTVMNLEDTAQLIRNEYIQVYQVAASIVKAEYFIDQDPGFGNGINIPMNRNSYTILNFNAEISELNNGMHTLFMRVMDSNGSWSTTTNRIFLGGKYGLDPMSDIVQAEYFFDHDPGYGEGFQFTVNPQQSTELEFVIPLQNLDQGWHTLFFRARDENGKWGHVQYRPFVTLYVPHDPVNITFLEYFIDEDPGTGNATQVAISVGSMIEKSFLVEVESLPPGNHHLYVRARDDRGNWSIVFNQEFEIEALPVCSPPTALMASGITTNSAMLNWNPGGNETTWDILWGETGFDPETTGSLIEGVMQNHCFLEGLLPATNYDFYVRAVCNVGSYSNWAGPGFFATSEEPVATIPVVTTSVIEQIAQTTAISGGNIIHDGGLPVTARGVVWSTITNPTIGLNQGFTNDGAGTGSWISELAGLTPNTLYFLRAYATNGEGTAYGEQLSFETLSGVSPNWVVNPFFHYNMQIIGQLKYEDGTISLNGNDIVGAFVDEECRGVMSPNPNFMGMIFLTIGSNQQTGESVTFKAYISDEDRIVDLHQAMIFENLLQSGSIPNPFIFTYHTEIPEVLLLQNITVSSGQSFCYEAIRSIITGGNGNDFRVEPGAVVYLVARENIILYPGTQLKSGSEVHAFIDLQGGFCQSYELIFMDDQKKPDLISTDLSETGKFFSVYPNPTSGFVMLEIDETNDLKPISIVVYNMMGSLAMRKELLGQRSYLMDLTGLPRGIYIVRVLRSNATGFQKLTRQ